MFLGWRLRGGCEDDEGEAKRFLALVTCGGGVEVWSEETEKIGCGCGCGICCGYEDEVEGVGVGADDM